MKKMNINNNLFNKLTILKIVNLLKKFTNIFKLNNY